MVQTTFVNQSLFIVPFTQIVYPDCFAILPITSLIKWLSAHTFAEPKATPPTAPEWSEDKLMSFYPMETWPYLAEFITFHSGSNAS